MELEEWKEFRTGYSISNYGNIRNDITGRIRIPQKRSKKAQERAAHAASILVQTFSKKDWTKLSKLECLLRGLE